ncbi:GDSL esterase/lipase At4g16230-like [Silene latifolia]|uniref:GDSL esterase/lipase At4g16230-like n=1 Tax=Silene latifolia TaxID=37657 RepID=UPI003D771A1E
MATSKLFLHVFLLYFLLLACIVNAKHVNAGNVQGMFILGSSVVDNGNNNFNPDTTAKANYAPYGVDFPSGATGRFSNGKNIADILAECLGLPLIPAFADPRTKGGAITHGVNFGSGGSGILDDTGSIVGKVTTLNEQIDNFEKETLPALEAQVGSQRAAILPNYLFLIAAGNNDYLLNYFIGRQLLTPQAFAAKLISVYSNQLKRLYNLGARRFILVSVYPLGCSPVVSRGLGCLPIQNGVVSIFYDQLISMVDGLKQQLPASDIVVLNSVKLITDVINNAGAAGFSNTNGSCCQLSVNGASCQENGSVCNDRKSYVYFDGQHNTEALNVAFVGKAFASADKSDVYPVNLQNLLHTNF